MTAYSTYTDEELSALLRNGDEAAYTAIYNRYWDKLYFLAHKHLRIADAAEEIVQEVFLSLWKKRADLTIHSLSIYLAAMTRYTVYRALARKSKSAPIDIAVAQEALANSTETDTMDNKLLLEIIEKLSVRLPEKCRIVFVRNKLLDQPLDQVAQDMNISTKTAEAHLTKSLKIIRKNLGDSLSVIFL